MNQRTSPQTPVSQRLTLDCHCHHVAWDNWLFFAASQAAEREKSHGISTSDTGPRGGETVDPDHGMGQIISNSFNRDSTIRTAAN